MTVLIDYEGAAWSLTDEQKTFFSSMEDETGVPITVIHGRGQRKDRPDGIEGIVFIDYATNSESPTPRRVDAIARRNSTTVPLTNHFLLKPDDQREYIWDFNGFPLAEIRLSTIWSLTPLQNFGTIDLMKEFWADAIRMSMNDQFFIEKEEQKKKKIRDAFLNAMKAANEGEITEQQNQIQQSSQRLAKLNADLVAAQTEILKAEQRLQIAEKIVSGDQATYESEIGSLMKHRDVKKIDYDTSSGVLEVYTNMIYLYSPSRNERVGLGDFLIKVHTKNNNTVTLHNLTNKKSHKMHPHVEENGSACWGAIGTQVAKLAATCKVEGLADLCIRYLETYNVQDTNAQYARYWFDSDPVQTKRPDFDNQWMSDEEFKDAMKYVKEQAKKDKKATVTATEEKQVVQGTPNTVQGTEKVIG